MALKKENKVVPITLTPYHQKLLDLMCSRTGLSKTGVVQRLIEMHKLKTLDAEDE